MSEPPTIVVFRDDLLACWQAGRTGYPIVEAGMRELWATGWMHNRVRMITASFLTKDLLIVWQHGERWFWDCLVDAGRRSCRGAQDGADALWRAEVTWHCCYPVLKCRS